MLANNRNKMTLSILQKLRERGMPAPQSGQGEAEDDGTESEPDELGNPVIKKKKLPIEEEPSY